MPSTLILQEHGDHMVWRSGNIVKKTPNKPIPLEDVRYSIDLFRRYFGSIVPDTRIHQLSDNGYVAIQPYIDSVTFNEYYAQTQGIYPQKIRRELDDFARRALKLLEDTGICFDPIGYPYGLSGKGTICNSSNILITKEREPRVVFVDNIINSHSLRESSSIRLITDTVLNGRRKRKERFIENIGHLLIKED